MEKRRNTITYVAYSDIIPDCLATMVTPHTKAFPHMHANDDDILSYDSFADSPRALVPTESFIQLH